MSRRTLSRLRGRLSNPGPDRRDGGPRGWAPLQPSDAVPKRPTEAEVDAAIAVLRQVRKVELQWRGIDFQSRDYYSSVNDLDFLANNRDLWTDRGLPKGITWDLDGQLAFVMALAAWAEELRDVPDASPAGRPSFHWDNDFWNGMDALIHYALLRKLRPARVVEIGTGWSSLLMERALTRNAAEGGSAAQVQLIEPFPRKALLDALPASWGSQECTLQRADLTVFDALEAGDVCFYDGSHVSRAASDVNWFFFEVLPRLRPGVVVHLHDIFWPSDYPESWIFERGQTWNEQYLLQAFLMYNADFRILISNQALLGAFPVELERAFRHVVDYGPLAGSVWLVREDRA